jgi:hypothetical protein
MKKAAVVFSAGAVMAMMAVSVPTPAEARGGWGWGPGIAGGLLAGALIGGLASSAYGYGPGYGYYGPRVPEMRQTANLPRMKDGEIKAPTAVGLIVLGGVEVKAASREVACWRF